MNNQQKDMKVSGCIISLKVFNGISLLIGVIYCIFWMSYMGVDSVNTLLFLTYS